MRRRYPTDYKADLCLGYVAAEAGHPVEAKAHYLAALKNHPASVEKLSRSGGFANPEQAPS